MNHQNQQSECCPRFDPTPWDEKVFEWENKKFIKDRVFTFFYMPMNFGTVMKRVNEVVEKSGAKVLGGLWLSDHASKWNMDLYVAVDKEVINAENVAFSGKFFSKVYEGDFKDAGMWMKDFKSYTHDKKIKMKKTYIWYTTCPKCAKKYGKNAVVIIGQIH